MSRKTVEDVAVALDSEGEIYLCVPVSLYLENSEETGTESINLQIELEVDDIKESLNEDPYKLTGRHDLEA